MLTNSLPALIVAQAARTPDAVAVVAGATQLTYAALVGGAGQVAAALRAAGVGAEQLVGVAGAGSVLRPLAVLGVWQAGAAYWPLEPGEPAARVAPVLARWPLAAVVRVDADEALPPGTAAAGTPVVTVEAVIRAGGPAVRRAGRAGQAAYVLATSGSTGTPKGVVVTHAGLPGLATAQAQRAGVGPGARVLQFARGSFDASVSELAMTLTQGATLVLVPESARRRGPVDYDGPTPARRRCARPGCRPRRR